jgi:hypothetical protein
LNSAEEAFKQAADYALFSLYPVKDEYNYQDQYDGDSNQRLQTKKGLIQLKNRKVKL